MAVVRGWRQAGQADLLRIGAGCEDVSLSVDEARAVVGRLGVAPELGIRMKHKVGSVMDLCTMHVERGLHNSWFMHA